VDEAQQDVLCTDEIVVEQSRFLLGQHQDSSGSISETFEHALPPAISLPWQRVLRPHGLERMHSEGIGTHRLRT
jgi:hypothetical protein